MSGQREPRDPLSDELAVRFTYRRPTDEQATRMHAIREMCGELAAVIEANTPMCREQALAFTALEEVSMWVNAAIARREERS